MAEVQLKDVEGMEVMSLPFTGSYSQTRDKMDELMSWLLRAGHPYSSTPFALYYDDPSSVPEEQLRAEVCLPIEEACEGEGEIVRKSIPPASVACAVHKGPYSGIGAVYEQIHAWLRENGYRPVEGAPSRELFIVMHGQTDEPEEYVTEVQVPVEPVAASAEGAEEEDAG